MSNELTNRNNSWMDFGNEDLFNHFANHFFRNDWNFPNLISKEVMKTDVAENETAYTVTVDLPGLKKENIQVDYKDGILSINAKQEHENETKNDKNEIIHSERYFGAYRREYQLPNVARNEISAKYDQGVLTLQLPKLAASAPDQRIEIQ